MCGGNKSGQDKTKLIFPATYDWNLNTNPFIKQHNRSPSLQQWEHFCISLCQQEKEDQLCFDAVTLMVLTTAPPKPSPLCTQWVKAWPLSSFSVSLSAPTFSNTLIPLHTCFLSNTGAFLPSHALHWSRCLNGKGAEHRWKNRDACAAATKLNADWDTPRLWSQMF